MSSRTVLLKLVPQEPVVDGHEIGTARVVIRRRAGPGLRGFVGPMDGSHERRRGPVGHHHCVERERLDGALSRSNAGATRRQGL